MPTGKQPIRFLQLSDVVLDARLSFKDMDMTATKRAQRNEEALDSMLRLAGGATKREADAVLITGNLWDGQSVTASTVSRLVDCFASLGDIPVLICPGTTDPLSPQSFHNPNVLSAFGVKPWSRNVHIFSDAAPTGYVPPLRSDVCFIGRAQMIGRAAAALRAVETGDATCLVRLDHSQVATSDPALNDDFAYTACGGTANYTELFGADGKLRGAASGSLISRSLDELGQRKALWVELTPADGGATTYDARLTPIPSDNRRLISVSTNINGIRAQNVPEHIRKAIQQTDASEEDLVHIVVNGIYPVGSVPDFGQPQLAKMFYHVIVEDRTRPDYYLDKLDPRTTEGRFIQFLQEMKVKAESGDGSVPSTEYGAELSANIIEDALYYGLDALNQRKVTVPDVD